MTEPVRQATWQGAPVPSPVRPGVLGWLRVAIRAPILALVVFGGLALLLVLRLIERPLFGLHRPVTPWITVGVCRAALAILGIGWRVTGRPPMDHIGAIVSNHVSWLDIFALNAAQPIYFVSKAEVAAWPGIGWLARATGTVFIRREARDAKLQQQMFEDRLRAGHRLAFFPEGTSTDGLRVLPFKPTLFAAFYSHGLDRVMQVQPVTLIYRAPPGQPARFYGWWADMDFGSHLLKVMAAPRQGSIELRFARPLDVSMGDRKTLARAAEQAVRDGLPQEFQMLAGQS
ncbi:lysophospholipid acyltransferase family protein [Paracoccus sp. p4-l81]|uniref:lysophospholipid acyltransferase family protein n=1 Tax=Paracoccus sp. p4-l81 TaxID=3342806 RepID=UPI0035BAF118